MSFHDEFYLLVEGPDLSLKFLVVQGPSFIGRDATSSLLLNFPQVSRRHALLENNGALCFLTDLNSANGTYVNGEKLLPSVPKSLSDQDVIKIGPASLTLQVNQVEDIVYIPEQPTLEKKLPIQGPPPDEPPPTPPETLLPPTPALPPDGDYPPGLTQTSQRLFEYLPGIYQTDFMQRYLALFESILYPIEWNIDNFDLYLSPSTSPKAFLNWLSNWYEVAFDSTWSEEQRRTFLRDAHMIFARRGTPWGLCRVLEIYTGKKPEIVEFSDDLPAHSFKVKISLPEQRSNRKLIEKLIETYKPAHTAYLLEFVGRGQ
jgi:phage tail-like protein